MKGIVALTLVLATSCGAARAQDAQPSAMDLVKAGEAAAAKHDWVAAKAKFVEATMLDANSSLGYYDLGVALAHLGDFSGGAEAERKALALDKGNVPAYIELGVIQCQQKDFDGAVASLQKALQIEPDNMSAQKNLQAATTAKANAAAMQRRVKPAKEVTASAKVKAPLVVASTTAGRLDAGITAFKKGDLDAARVLFEQVLITEPNNAQAHANLGVVLGTMGSPDQQIIEEKRAVQIDAKYVAAWVNLGWAESKRERWGDALIAYQRALALDAAQPEALSGQALALFREGKEEAGIAAIKLAIRTLPDPTQAKIALANMLQAQSRYREAETELREALKLSPNNAEAKRYLAMVSKLASKDDSTK